jgi:hypothetical protein
MNPTGRTIREAARTLPAIPDAASAIWPRLRLAVAPCEDAFKRQILVERRPVNPERRELDRVEFTVRCVLQPRIALDRKTLLLATGKTDVNPSLTMSGLRGRVPPRTPLHRLRSGASALRVIAGFSISRRRA